MSYDYGTPGIARDLAYAREYKRVPVSEYPSQIDELAYETACVQEAYETACVQEARLIDEYRLAIDVLEGVVNETGKRVQTVSAPYYGESGPGADVPQPDVSKARFELHRLHSLAGQLRGILDRLEV